MSRVLSICSAAILASACGRIGFDSQASLSVDASSSDTVDAGNSNAQPDAFAGCDAGCTTGIARVQLRDSLNMVIPDVPVVVSFPDGTISAVTTTGPNGVVDVEVVPSSMVTLSLDQGLLAGGAPDSAFFYTVAGVQPGDDLVLGSLVATAASTSITVSFPGDFAGATQYSLTGGCGSTSSSSSSGDLSFSFDTSCGSQGILGTARDADGSPLAYSFVAVGGAIPTNVSLPAWNSSFSTVPMSVTGTPTGAVSGGLSPMQGDATYTLNTSSLIGDAATDFRIPAAFGDRWATEVYVEGNQSTLLEGLLIRVSDQMPAAITIDLDTDFLPVVSDYAVSTALAARPEVSWTNPANPGPRDMGLGLFAWDGPNGVGEWVVIFPPDGGPSIQLPALPDTMANMRPDPDGTLQTILYFVDADYVAGYDAVRANPNLQTLFSGSAPFSPPATGPYEVRATVLGNFGPP